MVVDNASTDGTDALLARPEPTSTSYASTQNTGGAGGFAVGIERALTHRPDLVWLLDDDTIPTPDAAAGAGPHLEGVRRRQRPASRRARQQGRVDRRPRPPDEHPAPQAGGRPRRDRRRRQGRRHAGPVGVVRLDHVRRRRGPRARAAAGRLLPLERRLRVLHPADPRPRRPLLPGQRGAAQDQGLRLHRRRPGGAVLLRGAQQGLAVHPLARPDAGGEGGLRRLHPAPLGAHLRQVRRPTHAAAGAGQGAQGRAGAAARGPTRPCSTGTGAEAGHDAAARAAVRPADQHVRRRPGRLPARGVRLHRARADPATRPGGARAGRPGAAPSSPTRSPGWPGRARSRSRTSSSRRTSGSGRPSTPGCGPPSTRSSPGWTPTTSASPTGSRSSCR